MRAVLQRVSQAAVHIEGSCVGEITHGFLILLGVEHEDETSDLEWLIQKISQMRVFEDDEGKMNHSLQDAGGSCLVVSQFTLHASTKKGNRPSFIKAARPEQAEDLYESFCRQLEDKIPGSVSTGSFGANMQVSLINDGPVTIIIDSKDRK